MRFWKWEVWHWNLRKVYKSQSPLPDENSFHPPDEELEQRAKQFVQRATQLLEELAPHSATTHGDIKSLQYFLQSENCYAELRRRQDIRRADRERHEALERSERERKREIHHFWIELIVIGLLIVGEIGLSLYFGLRAISDGRDQAAVLRQMNKNTEDTAVQIQRAADATTASLEILRQELADRSRKPSPALYVGNIPIDRATVRPTVPNGPTQSIAHFGLLLKNEGDAPLSTSEIHALVPEGINIALSPVPPVPEYEEPSEPGTRTMSYWVPLTPVGKACESTARFSFQRATSHSKFCLPSRRPSFKLSRPSARSPSFPRSLEPTPGTPCAGLARGDFEIPLK